jgi:hypothetical protein
VSKYTFFERIGCSKVIQVALRLIVIHKNGSAANQTVLIPVSDKFSIFSQKKKWRHDTQHTDIQNNDTQHKGFICDTQYNWH